MKKVKKPRPELELETEDEVTNLLVAVAARNPVLYLDESADVDEPVILALVPPDLDRCQCEWSDTTAPTFGPRPIVRCSNEPTVIAFQKRSVDSVEPTGAMSLCDEHRIMVDHMYPRQCYYRRITPDRQVGELA